MKKNTSSKTNMVTLLKLVDLDLTRSIIRPGVPITISAPLSRSLCCSYLLPPPYAQITLIL